MIAGVLALVSAFSPWWGIGGAGEPTFSYGLFAGTYDSALTASQITRILVEYSPVILGLVILSGLFAILGIFDTHGVRVRVHLGLPDRLLLGPSINPSLSGRSPLPKDPSFLGNSQRDDCESHGQKR